MAAPKSLPPKAVRVARARKGGQAVHSVDAHIRALVKAAPRFTPSQIERLRALLALWPVHVQATQDKERAA
nr:hypothetical protein [Kibdelosporangium sp. MJ126-NF4]